MTEYRDRKVTKQCYVRSTYHAYSAFIRRVCALESKLEQDYFNLLNFERQALFVVQPTSISFSYEMKTRRYTPDFEITLEDGTVYVVEIKFEQDTVSDTFAKKCRLLSQYYEEEDKVFRVLTEQDIRVGERAENLRFLQPALRSAAPVEEFDAFTQKLHFRTAPLARVASLLEQFACKPCLIRRATAHQLFKCDLTQPWGPELQLSW